MRTFAAYLGERFRLHIFGPAILGLALLAAWSAEPPPTAFAAARSLVLMSLLVVLSRVWDDLEDRDHDAQKHPDRVLVRASPAPFRGAVVGLFAVTALMLERTGTQPALLALLVSGGLAVVAYRWIRPYVSGPFWSRWLLLAKYPAFVVIATLAIGPAAPGRLAASCLFAFAAAHLYERAHTRAAEPGASR